MANSSTVWKMAKKKVTLMQALKVNCELEKTQHKSFESGRSISYNTLYIYDIIHILVLVKD